MMTSCSGSGSGCSTFIDGDIVDLVTVNLYNAKDPDNITFEQRTIGQGNNVEEILAC